MEYRASNSQHCSPTLMFFNAYCLPRDIAVNDLIRDLEKIGNIGCKRVLCTWLGESCSINLFIKRMIN